MLFILSGVSFIQKELPKISDVQKLSRKDVQKINLQINATFYQTDDAMPLCIKKNLNRAPNDDDDDALHH